tara:strand:- start:157 stop:522 length:366 start_codon:yes stop_codon:yes gene_type:complete
MRVSQGKTWSGFGCCGHEAFCYQVKGFQVSINSPASLIGSPRPCKAEFKTVKKTTMTIDITAKQTTKQLPKELFFSTDSLSDGVGRDPKPHFGQLSPKAHVVMQSLFIHLFSSAIIHLQNN